MCKFLIAWIEINVQPFRSVISPVKI